MAEAFTKTLRKSTERVEAYWASAPSLKEVYNMQLESGRLANSGSKMERLDNIGASNWDQVV